MTELMDTTIDALEAAHMKLRMRFTANGLSDIYSNTHSTSKLRNYVVAKMACRLALGRPNGAIYADEIEGVPQLSESHPEFFFDVSLFQSE